MTLASTVADGPVLANVSTPPGGYAPPSIAEFFYEPLFGSGIFAVNRIVLMMLLMTGVLCLVFGLGFRRPQIVPRGLQNVLESGTEFVRTQIGDEVIGKEASRRFSPYLTALFFFILAFNITSIIPGLNLPINGLAAVPLILAISTWIIYNVQGAKAQGLGPYVKGSLFPPGIPGPIYLLVTPIEFFSTFVLRPVTLFIRLLANMIAGHLILGLFFSASTYLFLGYQDGRWWTAFFGLGAFAGAIVFTFFEALVAVLQAYIFTLLTAVYLAGSLEPDH